MEEARDTPVIMIIEKPSLPSRPDPRGVGKFGALAGICGLLLGIGAGVLLDLRDRRRGSADSYVTAAR
jgi:uncharacterized protein involved in exopolysaccharide biosynthesis